MNNQRLDKFDMPQISEVVMLLSFYYGGLFRSHYFLGRPNFPMKGGIGCLGFLGLRLGRV
jgi:hypothetical protein